MDRKPGTDASKRDSASSAANLGDSAVMRRFLLVRYADPSGVSGTGIVAEGIRFGDGTVALRWTCTRPATAVWDSVDDMLAVHGHADRTVVRWLDPANDSEYGRPLPTQRRSDR